jgi:hypothetical protein
MSAMKQHDEKHSITVIQVFELMGVLPTKEKTWAVGNRMQHIYALEHGTQPPKDNRPKTSGGGSHCFALYPKRYLPIIKEEIRKAQAIASGQMGMFD